MLPSSFHTPLFECLSSDVAATSPLPRLTQLGVPSSWVFLCRSVLWAQILDSQLKAGSQILQVPMGPTGTCRINRLAGDRRSACECLLPWQAGEGCKAQCTEPQENAHNRSKHLPTSECEAEKLLRVGFFHSRFRILDQSCPVFFLCLNFWILLLNQQAEILTLWGFML